MKHIIFIMAVLGACSSVAQADDAAYRIGFGIDCMVHDAKGALLKDLGMIGVTMGSSYVSTDTFEYNGLKIIASLQGPFASTPEVGLPQLSLSVTDQKGSVLSAAIISATEDMNLALLIPQQNAYLHCDKMSM